MMLMRQKMAVLCDRLADQILDQLEGEGAGSDGITRLEREGVSEARLDDMYAVHNALVDLANDLWPTYDRGDSTSEILANEAKALLS